VNAPRDVDVIAQFRSHRTEIDTLMTMMREDRDLLRVDDNWTDPASSGISAQRIATYRRMLASIGYPRGFYYDPTSGRVTFMVWAAGLAGSGSSKSLMYKPEKPSPLVDDLDAYRPPKGQDYALAFRHIEGDWYLEYDAD
jgi:hypothetical protein